MKFDLRSLNRFLLLKIPIARLAGIRVVRLDDKACELTLRHRWLNQNPFGSVYFGVLVMGGELATGIPLFKAVNDSGRKISMLVKSHRSEFLKKATGRIRFVFDDMEDLNRNLQTALQSGEKHAFELHSRALDEQGETVATFSYLWSVKCYC